MKAISLALCVAMLSPVVTAQSRTDKPASTSNPTASTASADRQTLPLKRVVLYSNGVAYFERRGRVTGRAEIALDFKQTQVDDVLKSMVVLDLGKGRVGSVSYNSSTPPGARLGEIPFALQPTTDANDQKGGLAGVLAQLQGARVTVAAGSRTVTGAVLTVEHRKSQLAPDKLPVISNFLVLSAEGGELVSVDFSEIRSLKLADGEARKDIETFTEATAAARRRDSKTILITSDGAGEREMVVSYTLAAPIWKTTYRVVLDQAGKPFFQGWAIVDNVSEEDWSDVALSLVSGSPTSFIQPIQQPLYKYREVKPLPEGVQEIPQDYVGDNGRTLKSWTDEANERNITAVEQERARIPEPAKPMTRSADRRRDAGAKLDSAQNMSTGGFGRGIAAEDAPAASTAEAIRTGDAGVAAAATGGDIGDLFEYKISQPVSVPRNRSAMIPIVQEQFDGERVSIFNEARSRDRAFIGFRFENSTALTFESGPLTVIDGDSYAGESAIPRVKPKDRRFVAFGVDLATRVEIRPETVRDPVSLIKVADGKLNAFYFLAQKKTYTLTNQTDRPRTVYVEHQLRDGWQFSDDTEKPSSKGEGNLHRFRVELGARETKTLVVTERQKSFDAYDLTQMSTADFELFVNKKYIDEASRKGFDNIFRLRNAISAIETRKEKIEAELTSIEEDQERLRKNIEALGKNLQARQLIARYVAKANQQETRIEQLKAEQEKLEGETEKLEAELLEATQAVAFERKI
jgi:acyl CoA:acetate/3-ketoacid CoA transferase alpha subunit